MSDPGSRSRTASAAAAVKVSAEAAAPTSDCSTSRARTGRSATPIRQTRASPIAPPPLSGDHGGHADQGEVAVAAGHLLERPACARRTGRDPDLDDALVVVERRGEVRHEEVVGRDHALARVLRTTISASVIAATAGSSADASAWAMLPPIVPRLRIETCPM